MTTAPASPGHSADASPATTSGHSADATPATTSGHSADATPATTSGHSADASPATTSGHSADASPATVGDAATLVRSKNAGPFWQTLDVFLPDDAAYQAVAEAPGLDAEAIGHAYRVDPATILIFRLPSIRVVKISFPRPVAQGGVRDRDMHAGQQHVPLALLPLDP